MESHGEALVSCETCGQVQRLPVLSRGKVASCVRCDSVIRRVRSNSRARTAALSLAAIFLYVPANIYPIMMMEYLGRHTENTVWSGVRALYRDGMWAIAIVVFTASILVPFLKLTGLFFLVSVRGNRWRKMRTWIFKIVSQIGAWAMLDVFLLSVLVALLRFGRFATVIPGIGIYAFTSVVVLTLFASASFDPRLIWEGENFESHKKR